jgi:hypothetical protein
MITKQIKIKELQKGHQIMTVNKLWIVKSVRQTKQITYVLFDGDEYTYIFHPEATIDIQQ